jgi:hypothetical protein
MDAWCLSSAEKLAWAAATAVLLILLYQSLQQFCRPTQTTGKLARNGLLLAALIMLNSFLAGDLSRRSFGDSQPVRELRSAVDAIAANDLDAAAGRMRVIRPEAFLSTVSAQTLRWLKDSKVSYQLVGETAYEAHVLLPDGVTYGFVGGLPRNR